MDGRRVISRGLSKLARRKAGGSSAAASERGVRLGISTRDTGGGRDMDEGRESGRYTPPSLGSTSLISGSGGNGGGGGGGSSRLKKMGFNSTRQEEEEEAGAGSGGRRFMFAGQNKKRYSRI